MGKKAKIIILVVSLAGCEPIAYQPPPPPMVKTTTWKVNHSVGVQVEYFNHTISTDNNGRPNGPATISFTKSEDIKEYREQIQAMLKELQIIEDQISAEEQKEEQEAHEKP